MEWLDFPLMKKELQRNTVKTLITDFEGAGKFEDVPMGKYYIFGITETRGSSAGWDMPIDTNNVTDTIILDQNNAENAS